MKLSTLKKEELITELVSRGFTQEAAEELTKTELIGAIEEYDEQNPSDETGEGEGEGAVGVDEVQVYGKNGYIRTYSKEVHGKDFAELARQFASNEPDRTLKA